MLKAVIDIGTNTFHLLIGEITGTQVKILFKKTIAVKLGEGGINKGEITEAAYNRGIKALEDFSKELTHRNINKIKATATAAVRDASNGKQFINEVYEKTNIKIDIIDGQEEANYIYQGAKAAGALDQETSLIMDIGGGSVEFIISNAENIFWKNSYRLGAARLLADYYKHDPLKKEDIDLLHQHFDNQLQDLIAQCKLLKPQKLIGTAGAFDSYREIISLKKGYNNKEEVLYPFDTAELIDLLLYFTKSTHQERADMKGLIPLRTDMILMSSILSNHVINKTGVKAITACSYSLKEGLLYNSN